MATSAYLLIKAPEAVRHNGCVEAFEELRALPEIEYVEPVSGLYDYVARVEAPMARMISLIHNLIAKSWVEGVHVLGVDQLGEGAQDWEGTRRAELRRQREMIRAYRARLQRMPLSARQPYASRAAVVRAELEEARSLARQRQILEAACEEGHRIPAKPAPDR